MSYSLPSVGPAKAGLEMACTFRKSHEKTSFNSKELKDSGIPLDVDGKDVYISDPEKHCMICGASGKGKTRRVLYPLVTMSARAGRSMVIADMKGEIYRNTAKEVEACGVDIKVINLRNPAIGDRFSPLSLVQQYWDLDEKSRAMTLLKGIADILVACIASEKDKYWENTASDTFMGFALLLLENSFPLTFDSIQCVGNQCLANESRRNDLREMLGKNSEAKRKLEPVLSLEEENRTLSCVASEFNTMLSPYVSQEEVRDLLSSSDIFLADIGKKPTAVYLLCPDESTSLYGVASLFVEQCYSELISYADSREDNTLPVKVDFILDEFGSFVGSSWAQKLTAARSRGIRFILALQALSQLSFRYGHDASRTIASNCRTFMFMGGRDISTLSEISALCGEKPDISGIDKPVLSVSKLSQLGKDEVVVLDDLSKPYIGTLVDWSAWGIDEKAKLSENVRHFKTLEPVDFDDIRIKFLLLSPEPDSRPRLEIQKRSLKEDK
jgi:type IV secretion system protein VirD4